ncbi:MAG: hypothetical protein IJX50_00620 [Clostridia bacterium]|nr:hypothetical protein [Clostridia bacterium]
MKKIIAILTSLVLLAVSASAETTKATTNQFELSLSKETLSFLSAHNVDLESLSVNAQTRASFSENCLSISEYYESAIKSIQKEAEVYGFTSKQIENYINATLSSTPKILRSKADAEKEALEDKASPLDYYADNKPKEDGIGWEVKSLPQFSHATTFVTLPTVQNKTSNAAPYLFYTVANPNESWGIDLGVGYEYGDTGLKWRGFHKTTGNKLQYDKNAEIMSNNLYFKAFLYPEDHEYYGYLNFTVCDGDDIDTIYFNYLYYVADHNIYPINGTFIKQVTLCDNLKQYNCGMKILNAQFSQSYLYSTPNNTNSLMLPSNCEDGETANEPNRCGKFGTNSNNAEQVTQNSSTKWHTENISISF